MTTHPGTHIRNRIHGKIEHKLLVQATGLSHTMVSKLLNEKSALTAETAVKVEKTLGLSAEELLHLQLNLELLNARRKLANWRPAIKIMQKMK